MGMGSLFLIPQWFFGYDVALELLFAVVTLLVSFYAFKIYKLSMDNNLKFFSLSFFLIALSYLAQAVLNFIILDRLDDTVCGMINLQSVYLLDLFGIYFHSILFLLGLIVLAYVAMKMSDPGTFFLILFLVLGALYFSPYKTFMLYFLSTIILGLISFYYIRNYWNNRKTTSLLVAISMVLLFISCLYFIFATENMIYYVIGHALEFIAYLVVLVSLFMILRVGRKHGKKAR